MKKLFNGIVEFQKNIRPEYRETFARLALGQFPDALFITCSDSRVAPNLFASNDPGDLFVVRNVGNIVAPCDNIEGLSIADESEAAAIEFAVSNLKVKDIIVCGHSDCGAMHAILKGREKIATPNLKAWLRHAEKSLQMLREEENPDSQLPPHNRLSQINVLQQIENLKSYPIIQHALASKQLRIHAWWFELATASVYFYIPVLKKFIAIDEKNADQMISLFSNSEG